MNDQRQVRLEKIDDFIYRNDLKPTYNAKNINNNFKNITGNVSVAGRIVAKRLMGKACFLKLRDCSGDIQVYFKKNEVDFDLVESFDIGDIIFVEGSLFHTQKGELTIWGSLTHLVSKALLPLPDKYHGLNDVEIRYRQRYLDLIANPDVMKVMHTRSKIVRAIRNFFDNSGFIEVETPMMQVQPGGANAKPFATHLNALNLPLYLRIAPELYLKRLIVGGFDAVYELNRNFRNEGMSTRHNPEFTMIEFYKSYENYHGMMDLTEKLFAFLKDELCLPSEIEYQNQKINIDKFERISLEDLLIRHHNELVKENVRDKAVLMQIAQNAGLKVSENMLLGALQLMIFEETIESKLQQPTFVTDYPVDVSPLARKNNIDPYLSERFELFIVGRELANGFSEINDPLDQAERFRAQLSLRTAGDDEAMSFDEDYICALEHGMPPTAGQGIGIDRLVMLFTNQASIRDVILFPTMRPKSKDI